MLTIISSWGARVNRHKKLDIHIHIVFLVPTSFLWD